MTVESTLLAAALASLGAGAFFVATGFRLLAAARMPQGRPLVSFVVFWMAIGLATVVHGLRALSGGLDWHGGVVSMVALGISFTAIAMWGLISYMGYIYTGRLAVARIACWAYGILGAVTIGYIMWVAPHRVIVRSWTVDAVAVDAPLGFGVDLILTFAFLVPPLLAGILLLRMLSSTQDAEQRRRIVAVGLGIPLWVAAHLLARVGDADAWQFFARVVLGLGVAIAIFLAYGAGPKPAARFTSLEERIRALV